MAQYTCFLCLMMSKTDTWFISPFQALFCRLLLRLGNAICLFSLTEEHREGNKRIIDEEGQPPTPSPV